MKVIARSSNGSKKLLNYLEYTKNLDLDVHLHVFKQAIKINSVTQEGTKVVYF
jgi:hypothetical protein